MREVLTAILCGALLAGAAIAAPPEGTAPAPPPSAPAAVRPAADAEAHADPTLPPPAAVKTQRIAFLGTATTQATPLQQTESGLPESVGLQVQHVLHGSPADLAGLQRGDVLQKLDDQLLINDAQFRVLLRLRRPGDVVELTGFRDGRPRRFTAKLGERDVPVGEVPPAELLPWLLKPPLSRSAVAATGFSGSYKDAEHELDLSTRADGQHLVVKDSKGEVLFNGPINTPAERAGVPEAVRGKLRQLETPPKSKLE